MDRVEKLPSLARVVKHYAESYSPGYPVSEIRSEWFTACFAVPRVGCLPKGKCPEALSSDRQEVGQTEVSHVSDARSGLPGGTLGDYVPQNSDWLGLLRVP